MAKMPNHNFSPSDYGTHCVHCGYQKENDVHMMLPDTRVGDKYGVASTMPEAHTTPVPKANEVQVGGNHYKTGGEEHWDRVDRLRLDYFQGQITKYVERWKKKNGIQDLEKAEHFLQKYIELERAKVADATPARTMAFRDKDRAEPALKEDSNG